MKQCWQFTLIWVPHSVAPIIGSTIGWYSIIIQLHRLSVFKNPDRVGVTCAKEANIGNICKPVYMCMEAEGNIVLNSTGMATRHPGTPELEFGSPGSYASLWLPMCSYIVDHLQGPTIGPHESAIQLYLSVHAMCEKLLVIVGSVTQHCSSAITVIVHFWCSPC